MACRAGCGWCAAAAGLLGTRSSGRVRVNLAKHARVHAARTLGGTLPASVLVLPVMEPTMMQRGWPLGAALRSRGVGATEIHFICLSLVKASQVPISCTLRFM
jgi:hypothetical protein